MMALPANSVNSGFDIGDDFILRVLVCLLSDVGQDFIQLSVKPSPFFWRVIRFSR